MFVVENNFYGEHQKDWSKLSYSLLRQETGDIFGTFSLVFSNYSPKNSYNFCANKNHCPGKELKCYETYLHEWF